MANSQKMQQCIEAVEKVFGDSLVVECGPGDEEILDKERLVRIVLEALRKPTKEMIVAGNDKAADFGDYDSGPDPAQIFDAMIDTVLSEGQHG